MDTHQWDKIQDHFHHLLTLPAEEQVPYLKKLKQEDSESARQVEKMLEAHYRADTFLDKGVLEDDDENLTGSFIGPWKILKQIGRGGMSTVYLAERADGRFDKQVAVKFLHGMMPGRDLLRRLQAEQRILARLDHRNIARLLDAGITEQRRPFFILEYIDGQPLLEWCNSQKLSPDERLAIFEQVCEAVQYAHQRLIVHRDLKPGNILVNKDGEVKLLDFGIAKLLDEEPAEEGPHTRTGLHLMTPEYAGPEQLNGELITTATDVYALGLLLCELLTGRLPYETRSKTPFEIREEVLFGQPSKPSTLAVETDNLSSQYGSGDLSAIRKKLKGDLDNIILKALRKDVAHRYKSAEQLLDDLSRYKRNLPVSARPESALYRFRKFTARNRAAVASGVLIFLVLTGATVYSVLQARAAEIERQKAVQLSTFLQEMLAAPNPFEDGRDVKVIEILERTSQRAEQQLAGQPGIQGDVYHILGVTYRELGLYDEAALHLSRALSLREQHLRQFAPELTETRAQLGILRQRQGEYAAADSLLSLALESSRSETENRDKLLLRRLNDLATLRWETGDYTSTGIYLEEALEIYERLYESGQEVSAVTIGNLATLTASRGNYREALELHRREYQILMSRYGEEHPSVPLALSHIGIILEDLDRHEEAETHHRKALDLYTRLKGEEHPDVAYAKSNLASVLIGMDRFEEGSRLQLESAELLEAHLGSDHPAVGIQYNNIAATQRRLNNTGEAEFGYRKAIEIWQAGLPPDHPYLAHGYTNLGSVLMSLNRYDEAFKWLEKAFEIRSQILSAESPEWGVTASLLGQVCGIQGDGTRAEKLLRDGYTALLGSLGNEHRLTTEAEERLTDFLRTENRYSEIEEIRRQAVGYIE